MTILQKSFMLRTPDGLVEKISIQERFVDCAPYVSKSGATFNGCFRVKNGELVAVRGLYTTHREPVLKFMTRAKITRDIDEMRDLIGRFLREFNILGALVYFDNYEIIIHDAFRKAIMLEDTPFFSQKDFFVYKLNISVDLSGGEKSTKEKIFGHELLFANPVNIYDALREDFHIAPGYGFVVQKVDDEPMRIVSQDYGEEEISLPAGLWLFIHSPPRKND
jgi:hypothetical protein